MEWSPNHITALASAIGLVIAAMFSERVVKAAKLYLEWRAESRRERMSQLALDRELDESGFKAIIRRQDRHIGQLEETCNQLRRDHDITCDQLRYQHSECEKELAVMRVKYDSVVKRLVRVEKHTQTPEEGEGI